MSLISSQKWLHLKRIVRFGDTDAAGVMHFHQVFRWCHEAWEESLDLYGVGPKKVFPDLYSFNPKTFIILPIVHCEADFLAPIQTGDRLSVEISPEKLDLASFKVETKFKRDNRAVAIGILVHRSINAETKKNCELPEGVARWIESSVLHKGITSI
tara:strand:- start:178 stop:645 length:468 start_codon:yes stop_codon:yes gene_type:complete